MTEDNSAPAPPEESVVPTETPAPKAIRRVRWLALALLALGVILVVLFGVRTVHAWRNFHEVRGRPLGDDVNRLRPWMTIPDLARDFDVPLDYLYSELGVEPKMPDRRTLRDLDHSQPGGRRGAFMEKAATAILAYRAQRQEGPPPPGNPPDRPPKSAPSPLPTPRGAP